MDRGRHAADHLRGGRDRDGRRAIGCGSLFFSNVNDAGFWLINQYFGMSVGDTIKTWSVMETIISVVGVALVMVMSFIV